MFAVIAGARPNFMKIAPLFRELKKHSIEAVLIHTGQHEGQMSDVFLEEFGLRVDYQLHPPLLPALTSLLARLKPKLVIVVGDVDSTLAGAIAVKANGLKLVHIEAGLRSFDNTMKEERNRIVVDSLSDYLFVSEESGMTNLSKEAVEGKCFLVGNIMMDNLVDERQGLVTLHRPSNVDNKERLISILDCLRSLNRHLVWPMHPRTENNLEKFGLDASFIQVIPPVSHADLIRLIKDSEFVITDSGGIQEEAVFLGRTTYTLRDSTERPITLNFGNQLTTPQTLSLKSIPLWDGHTAERIITILVGIT